MMMGRKKEDTSISDYLTIPNPSFVGPISLGGFLSQKPTRHLFHKMSVALGTNIADAQSLNWEHVSQLTNVVSWLWK